jgi:hypothetical protein
VLVEVLFWPPVDAMLVRANGRAQVNIPAAIVRRKALFWVNHGVLRESRGPPPGYEGSNSELWYYRAAELPAELDGTLLAPCMHRAQCSALNCGEAAVRMCVHD